MAMAATTDFAKITTKLTVVKMIVTITVIREETKDEAKRDDTTRAQFG
jgi:hypothetical protein